MLASVLGYWLSASVPRAARRIYSIGKAHRAERQASETEAQRRQGARLLHDTVLATLTLLAHSGVGVAPEALRQQASEDARLLRQLRLGATPTPQASGPYNLTPVEETPLGTTLESVKQRFGRMGLEVSWHGTGQVLLPSDVLDAFLLSLAECLENVRRHSGVTQAHVTITDDATTVRAMVTDCRRRLRPRRHRRRQVRVPRIRDRPPPRGRRQRPPVLEPRLRHDRRSRGSQMSSFLRPDENTLGVIFGRRNKGGPPGVAKAFRQASARGATLGTGYLGVGAGVLSAIQALYGLSLFASQWSLYPDPWLAAVAWVLYVAAFVTALITVSVRGDRLPLWLFVVYLVALAGVVALDFFAIWPLHNIGAFATASVSAGFGLMIVVTLRRGREVLAAAGVLGLAFVVAIVHRQPPHAQPPSRTSSTPSRSRYCPP